MSTAQLFITYIPYRDLLSLKFLVLYIDEKYK